MDFGYGQPDGLNVRCAHVSLRRNARQAARYQHLVKVYDQVHPRAKRK